MVAARCIKCGGENPKEALFCTVCGQALHQAQNDPFVGQTIGDRYYLVERIGQGAAGTIYRAEHTALRRRIAVKLLHQQLAQNDDAVERFRREAITVCEIDNDHIPQVFDFGRSVDGRLYFAMEFLDGQPLSAVLENEGRLTPERTCDLLTQIADGLLEAHTLGYVHRDLRPRSIFLTRRRGRADFVKILDFGLAKLVQPDLTDAQRTAMGMTYGDPRYMAPEQARGEQADRRADVYSLGVLGFEMLCGEPPIKGQGTFEVLSKLLEAPVARLRDKRPDCPPWLESVIRSALAKKPTERFQTVAQFLDAMERKNVLINQPPLPVQVGKAVQARAAKNLSPIVAEAGGQEVRAFVSQPLMEVIRVPVPEPVPVPAVEKQASSTSQNPMARALAAAVTANPPPAREAQQSIKKTLAYPAVQVNPANPTVRVNPEKPATQSPEVPKTAAEARFVNIVATTLERGDPTPRTAAALVKQETLAWEEAALPALVTQEVELQPTTPPPNRAKFHPSADTPVEEMKFEPAAPEPARKAAAERSGPSAPLSDHREARSKEAAEPPGQRDSSRVLALSTPAPVSERQTSGPAPKSPQTAATVQPTGTAPQRQIGAEENSDGASQKRRTNPGFGALLSVGPLPVVEVKLPAPVESTTTAAPGEPGEDDDSTVPDLRQVVLHRHEKVETAAEKTATGAALAETDVSVPSEKTPESPPPEMAQDAGWFSQAAQPGLADEDDAGGAKKKMPLWAIGAVLAAAALGVVAVVSSGPGKKDPSSSVVSSPLSPSSGLPVTSTTTELSKPTAKEPVTVPEQVAGDKPPVEAVAAVAALPIENKVSPEKQPPETPPVVPKPAVAPTSNPAAAGEKAGLQAETKTAPPTAKAETKTAPPTAKAEQTAEKTGEVAQLVALGRQKLDEGEVEAAVAGFKRAVQLEPKQADAVAGLGEALFEQGDFEAATKYLRQASRLAPRKFAYQELLAQALFKLGRYQDAADICRKVLANQPGANRAKQTLEQAEKKLQDM